jgi:hypothetical protein
MYRAVSAVNGPVGNDRNPLRLVSGFAGAFAVFAGALIWTWAASDLMALTSGDICLESTCGDPDPALVIGLGVPAVVGIIASLALSMRLVHASRGPTDERWKGVRKAAYLTVAALAIWAGIISVLAFLG